MSVTAAGEAPLPLQLALPAAMPVSSSTTASDPGTAASHAAAVSEPTLPCAPTSAAPAAPTQSKPGPSSSKNHKWKNSTPPPPTNCVVLKNLDYNITQLALEEVVRRVTGGRKEFVNIALIDDKATGSFRGMAFVNFHTTADATTALAELSKMVINGRKVIAEFRRLRPGEKEKQEKRAKKFDHFNNYNRQTFEKDVPETDEKGKRVDKRAAFFAKRDTVKKVDEQKRNEEKAERDKEREADFRKILLEYKDVEVPEGTAIEDIVFESTLTPYERRMVHTICNELDLGHISRVDEDGNRVLHVTKDPERKAEWEKEAATLKAAVKKDDTQKRKNKENGDARASPEWKKGEPTTGGPLTKEELQGIKWFKPRAAMGASAESGDGGIRAPSYKLYVPPRQPSGPDGTIGFASRNPNTVDEGAGGDTAQENGAVGSVSYENGTSVENGNLDEATDADDTAGDEAVKNGGEEKPAEKHVESKEGKGSTHTVLNPSVPAFSPSFTQTY